MHFLYIFAYFITKTIHVYYNILLIKARGISDARLQEILLEKFQRLENGNTFVRKLLFVYWLLKIEYDDKLRDSLKKVCLEDISDNERKVKLQEISDAFYSDNVSFSGINDVNFFVQFN